MRARAIWIFLFGFLAGALCLYYALWRTGGLVPGHPLALTTRELVSHSTTVFPTPTRALPPPVATPPPASPEPTATVTPPPPDGKGRSVTRD